VNEIRVEDPMQLRNFSRELITLYLFRRFICETGLPVSDPQVHNKKIVPEVYQAIANVMLQPGIVKVSQNDGKGLSVYIVECCFYVY
jgi:hypothetical protein